MKIDISKLTTLEAKATVLKAIFDGLFDIEMAPMREGPASAGKQKFDKLAGGLTKQEQDFFGQVILEEKLKVAIAKKYPDDPKYAPYGGVEAFRKCMLQVFTGKIEGDAHLAGAASIMQHMNFSDHLRKGPAAATTKFISLSGGQALLNKTEFTTEEDAKIEAAIEARAGHITKKLDAMPELNELGFIGAFQKSASKVIEKYYTPLGDVEGMLERDLCVESYRGIELKLNFNGAMIITDKIIKNLGKKYGDNLSDKMKKDFHAKISAAVEAAEKTLAESGVDEAASGLAAANLGADDSKTTEKGGDEFDIEADLAPQVENTQDKPVQAAGRSPHDEDIWAQYNITLD